jgi:hypothetical protein
MKPDVKTLKIDMGYYTYTLENIKVTDDETGDSLFTVKLWEHPKDGEGRDIESDDINDYDLVYDYKAIASNAWHRQWYATPQWPHKKTISPEEAIAKAMQRAAFTAYDCGAVNETKALSNIAILEDDIKSVCRSLREDPQYAPADSDTTTRRVLTAMHEHLREQIQKAEEKIRELEAQATSFGITLQVAI